MHIHNTKRNTKKKAVCKTSLIIEDFPHAQKFLYIYKHNQCQRCDIFFSTLKK